MKDRLKELVEKVTAFLRSLRRTIQSSLGIDPLEEILKEEEKWRREPIGYQSSEDLDFEGMEALSSFSVAIGLPSISHSNEDIPSGEVLPSDDYLVSSNRLEDRGRLYRIEDRITDLNKRLQNYKRFEDKVSIDLQELHDTVNNMNRMVVEITRLRDGYTSVEKNLHNLSSLYDLISSQFNPFVDSEPIIEEMSDPSGDTEGVLAKETEVENIFVQADGRGGYLEENPEIILLKWLAFLKTKVEIRQIPVLLKHYEETEVITREMGEKALRFLKSIKPTGVEPESRNDWRLSVEDQITSLDFVGRMNQLILEGSHSGKDPAG